LCAGNKWSCPSSAELETASSWDVVDPSRINDHKVGREPVIVVRDRVVDPIAIVVDVRLCELHAGKDQLGPRLGQLLAGLHLLYLHASGAHADDLAIVDLRKDVSFASRVDFMFTVLLDLAAKQSLPIEVMFLFGEREARGTDGAGRSDETQSDTAIDHRHTPSRGIFLR